MDLSTLIVPQRIICNVEAKSKKRALEIVSELLAKDLDDISQGDIFNSLVAREKLGSTAVGQGVALPHGRLAGLQSARAAFVRLTTPVDFGALSDDTQVDLIFALIMPAESADHDLQILAQIQQRCSKPAVCETLRDIRSSSELYKVITEEHCIPQEAE